MDEEDGDPVFIQRIDWPHIFVCMMKADPGAKIRQVEKEIGNS